MILDLLFPPRCAFCGRLLDENGKCPDCVLPWVEDGDALQRSEERRVGKECYS